MKRGWLSAKCYRNAAHKASIKSKELLAVALRAKLWAAGRAERRHGERGEHHQLSATEQATERRSELARNTVLALTSRSRTRRNMAS